MITFNYDASYRKGKLICDESMLTFIRNHFSEPNSAASFANRQLKARGSNRRVPDRNYAIQASGSFDFGLYDDIRKFLVSENITDVCTTPTIDQKLITGFGDVGVFDGLVHSLRDYQTNCVSECLRIGRGTVVSATGSGKSLMQASLLENWKLLTGKLNCLLIVPGTSLVSQLLKDFEDYKVTFTYSGWTGNMPKQDTEVVIVNTELLCSQFGNFKELVNIDLVFRDECHGTKSENIVTKIVNKIKTHNKFGFTGTLPKGKIDRWKVIGTFGPVIYEKNSKDLRDEKYLADVQIVMLKMNHDYKSYGYKQELTFIQTDELRHQAIRKIVSKLSKNVLILVNRLEHGDNLLEHLQLEGKEVVFVHGGVPVEERADIIRKMESQHNVVCIAMAAIFSTGINIKNLPYIIFSSGGKSFVRIIQSVGRGLRLHEDKNKLVIFDLYDNFKFSMEHAEERKQFYDEEQLPWREVEMNL